MKPWRDEWKNARLHLRLRGGQLFHGETVALDVYVEDAFDASSGDGGSGSNTPASGALGLQRWLDRCDGASADIKVVADDSGSRSRDSSTPHASATPRHASRPTLFRQEAELSAVDAGDASSNTHAPPRCQLLLRTEFELSVRSEYWDRPLSLVVRVTPKDAASGQHAGLVPSDDPRDDPVQSGALLSDDWLASSLLPLVREDSAPVAPLTKRLECPISVVKPLQVQVETRALTSRRVAVVVKAANTRADLALDVLDLQLHLSDSPSGFSTTKGASSRRYELADDSKVPFPVSLLALERYNFVFVLEPVDADVREPATPASPRSGAHPSSSNPPPSRGSAAVVGGDEGPEHALLTLTWKATDGATRAITEQHTIVWSPFALSLGASPTWEAPPPAEWSHFVVPQASAVDVKALDPSSVSFVTLRADSPLHVAFVPSAAPPARVGQVSTACVAVTNRSRHTTFDLTLVLPPRRWPHPPPLDASLDWISFEASHHLGLVRPGKSVRKSVHLAPLSAAGGSPDAVVLVDALTRTCFRALVSR